MAEQLTIQPVFDPANVGASLDSIKAQLFIKRPYLQGAVVGDTISLRKGEGYDIDGLRDYELGDDPRYIDWRGTARQTDGTVLFREHFQDVTPDLWLVTDMLQSRHQTNAGYFSEQNLALSALTAIMRIGDTQLMPTAVVAANNERIALRHKAPREGRQHLRHVAHELAAALPSSTARGVRRFWQRNRPEMPAASVSLAETLKYAAKRCTESMVVVVSDFRDVAYPDADDYGWKKPLQKLAKQGNDILAIELTNPWDYELPAHVTRFATPTGVVWIPDGKKGEASREIYKRKAAEQQAAIDETLAGAKTQHIKLSTADPQWLTSLRKQLRAANSLRRVA